MKLRPILSQYLRTFQQNLFPWLSQELGPLSAKMQRLVTILELVEVEGSLNSQFGLVGRPEKDRGAIARAFVAKAILNMPTTRALIERLQQDRQLRQICGWERSNSVPSEATFSRAFAEFSHSALPLYVHEALIKKSHEDRLVGHISRDSTKIEAREKPVKKPKKSKQARKKNRRGRPKKGEVREPKDPTRLQRQMGMSLEDMLLDLPKNCDVGVKQNSKGYKETWIGYKLHLDVVDGDIPVSALLSSASLHDSSQAAIPLAMISKERVTNLYDLADAAYDTPEIRATSQALGHVPIIDVNPRRNSKR